VAAGEDSAAAAASRVSSVRIRGRSRRPFKFRQLIGLSRANAWRGTHSSDDVTYLYSLTRARVAQVREPPQRARPIVDEAFHARPKSSRAFARCIISLSFSFAPPTRSACVPSFTRCRSRRSEQGGKGRPVQQVSWNTLFFLREKSPAHAPGHESSPFFRRPPLYELSEGEIPFPRSKFLILIAKPAGRDLLLFRLPFQKGGGARVRACDLVCRT